MTDKERIMRVLNANAEMLRRIDDVLLGRDKPVRRLEAETRLVTLVEAARRLGISRSTVCRMLKSGRLDSVTLDGIPRVTLRSVFELAMGLREGQIRAGVEEDAQK